jgi:hypothetical protein
MSWDQEYHVQSYMELLIKLTGKHPEELLEKYLLDSSHPHVTNKEEVVLDDGLYGPIMGTRVTLSNDTFLIPKLVERFNENGNHGIDSYEYRLDDGETPEVMNIGLDTSDSEIDMYSIQDNHDETDNPGWEG